MTDHPDLPLEQGRLAQSRAAPTAKQAEIADVLASQRKALRLRPRWLDRMEQSA